MRGEAADRSRRPHPRRCRLPAAKGGRDSVPLAGRGTTAHPRGFGVGCFVVFLGVGGEGVSLFRVAGLPLLQEAPGNRLGGRGGGRYP